MSLLPDIVAIITEGATNPWLYLPAAVALGALHALEPGHSKSIMAAFIVAVRGTPGQAVLLGVSAAIGHTIIVWILVMAALWFGNDLVGEQAYPWLVLASGLMILAIAGRLIWMLRGSLAPALDHGHDHDHDHDHDHPHPHRQPGHSHASPDEIVARYGSRRVGPWETIWFGFTGGLLPCPAAIAVLLVALKFKAVALGAVMVGAFSLGLAMTLVAIGVAAAWGAGKVAAISGDSRWMRALPLASSAIVIALGIGVIVHGIGLIAGQS